MQSAQAWITQFYLQTTSCLPFLRGVHQMPLGMEVDLGTGDIVLDGFPTPLQQWDTAWLNFHPMSVVAKQLDRSRCHLVRR